MIDPNLCPLPIRAAIDRYVKDRIRPGSFVMLVLKNDLFGAIKAADEHNLALIPNIAAYVSEHCPYHSYGSYDLVLLHLRGGSE